MEEQTRSLSEVAGLMGVSERTVRRWIKSGRLKAYKPGRDYRIPESGLRQFIEESEISPKVERRSSLEPPLFNGIADNERRDNGPLYTDYEAFGHVLASTWTDELKEWEEKIPAGEVPDRLAFGRLFEWALRMSTTLRLYESIARDKGQPRKELEETIRLMRDAEREAVAKTKRVFEPVRTYAEFRKIVEASELEMILSNAEQDV